MDERIPLFPLGTVLFPGAVLPLHIFEERYRLLVRELLDRPEPRRFGVVAIELGHEVGPGAARRLASVGCTAVVQRVVAHQDGRFDLVTVGEERFRITAVDEPAPYPRATVTPLPDEAGSDPDGPAAQVGRLFRRYVRHLADAGRQLAEPIDPPADPVRLSYFVAGAVIVDRGVRQRLLEASDAAARLRLEADLLARENGLLSRLPATPAPHFRTAHTGPN
ncbi:MAG TPA: LON peptidase substrate-binding domain-containing protein [Streptosporangiaceae bacterium]|nr:LON peptidase substrate-binding domain-containing protein [Streptosporangiaceae bacterium]